MGSNEQYQLSGSDKEYLIPTPIIVYQKSVIWATCGSSFTVYVREDGNLVFCGHFCQKINQNSPQPHIIEPKGKKKFVFASACSSKFCALDWKGNIYIFNCDLQQRPLISSLPIPAYDVVCGYSNISGKFYAIAVSVSGQAYGFDGLNNGLHHFSPIPQLAKVHIKRVYDHSNHLAFLTDKGQIWTYGSGNNGQCGNGTNEGNPTFKLIKCNENVVFSDAELGENHSIFITQDRETFSCGDNKHFQLCLGMTKMPILDPTPSKLVIGKAVGAACGSYHTLILTDSKKIEHPGIAHLE